MALQVEDLEDQTRYRQILKIPYDELASFVLDYIRRRSGLMLFFWSVCIVILCLAITIRINIGGYFPFRNIFFHHSRTDCLSRTLYSHARSASCDSLLSVRCEKDQDGSRSQTVPLLCNGTQTRGNTRTIPGRCLYSIRCYGNSAGVAHFYCSRSVEVEPLPVPVCSYHNVRRRFCHAELLLSP